MNNILVLIIHPLFIPIHPLEDEWVKIDPHSSPFIPIPHSSAMPCKESRRSEVRGGKEAVSSSVVQRKKPRGQGRYRAELLLQFAKLGSSQAYILKRRTLIQVPCGVLLSNDWQGLLDLSVTSFIPSHFILCMRIFCVRIGWRKYLNECTPFGYVSL